MKNTPFRDAAKAVARTKDYMAMSYESDRARSHAWWKNLVDFGAWNGPSGRVGPPDPDAIPGIAKLFETTEEQVSMMIAADWYGVQLDAETSVRAQGLGPVLDELSDEDFEIIKTMLRRFRHRPKLTPPARTTQ